VLNDRFRESRTAGLGHTAVRSFPFREAHPTARAPTSLASETLTAQHITVRFEKENMNFTGDDSPMNNLLLTLLGAVAEFERSMIRERQREGTPLPRPKASTPDASSN
jgi:hypothetical protein